MHHTERNRKTLEEMIATFTDPNSGSWEEIKDAGIDLKTKEIVRPSTNSNVACLRHDSVADNDGGRIAPITVIDVREFGRDHDRRVVRTFFVRDGGEIMTDIGSDSLFWMTPGTTVHAALWKHTDKSPIGDDFDYIYFDSWSFELGEVAEALSRYAKRIAFKAGYIARDIAAR